MINDTVNSFFGLIKNEHRHRFSKLKTNLETRNYNYEGTLRPSFPTTGVFIRGQTVFRAIHYRFI